MTITVSSIFKEPPDQWGLRGDPYLWDDLKKHFSNFFIPYSEEAFHKEIHDIFEKLTGDKMESVGYINIPKYRHGGMSNGTICQEFWLNKALPLLTNRLQQLNKKYIGGLADF